MTFLDDARTRLTRAAGQHRSTIASGIDKAAAAADRRTGGKHRSTIEGVRGKAKNALDRLDGKDGDLR